MEIKLNGVKHSFEEKEIIDRIKSLSIYKELTNLEGANEIADSFSAKSYLPEIALQYILTAILARVTVDLAKRHCINEESTTNKLRLAEAASGQIQLMYQIYKDFVALNISESVGGNNDTKKQ